MSDAGRQREWRCFIEDMIGFCERVLSYTDGLDRKTFVANTLVYDASLRNIELIGEAATRVPDSIRVQYPEIPWRSIVGMRNRIIHVYLGVDDDIIWSVIREDIPLLLPKLRGMLGAG